MKIRDKTSKNCMSVILFLNIAMVTMIPSCFNDGFNKAMKLELLPFEILIPLDDIPTPGNNGIISPVIANNTSIQIQWAQAKDKETAQSELVYRVYISDLNNIDTINLAEENGISVGAWQKDITSTIISSLDPGTTYYFNVIVRDSAGNKAAYVSIAVTTSTSPINVPVPGKGGIIITTAIGSTSIQLLWIRATDVETSQTDLEYSLYRSDSNNISTPDDADKNGTVVVSWQKDMVTALVNSLSPSTTYYFNVIVRDGDGNRVAYVSIAVTTSTSPINVPVPGNGGIITTTAVGSTSIQLSWTQATDVETSQPDLEYSMYRSDSNNINTPNDAVNNGTVVAVWQKDMVTALADKLSSGTTYYFNVVVRDGDGNRSAYVTIAVTTASDTIYMYSAGSYTGNLTVPTTASVRDDIDSLCGAKTAKTYSPPCLNRHAFISISSDDYIAYMPTKFGVPTDRRIISLTGIPIADNWFGLLDGTIDNTLSDAGITSSDWWSGSTSSGIYDTSVDNCIGWTYTGKKAQVGKFNKTNATWMQGDTPACSASRDVLCICW